MIGTCFIVDFMDQVDQVQLDITTTMASDDLNKEAKVFMKYWDSMSSILMTSWLDVANRAAGKGLIVMKPTDIQSLPKRVRATKLFEELIKKMDKTTGNPTEVWGAFIESTEDMPNLQKYLGQCLVCYIRMMSICYSILILYIVEKELKLEKSGQPEKKVFEKARAQIIAFLENNLNPVADKLFAKSILTSAEHQLVCNPLEGHENEVMRTILKDIFGTIKRDPSMMMVFIEDVLEEIGGPADRLARKMSKLHKL